MQYDVFNGDADGICALHQLRLSSPSPDAILVTGVKRNITLLSFLQEVEQSKITVLDISLDSNRSFLEQLLNRGNQITYIDHHFAGDIPAYSTLTTHIDTSPDICTSLIVDSLTLGRFRKWAIVGAFGDNLHDTASKIAHSISFPEKATTSLRELGELFNYNGYGETLDDLHIHPADLYKAVQPYQDPLEFISSSPEVKILRQGFEQDIQLALEQQVINPGSRHRIYRFPQTTWARRISGIFANFRARERKEAAHALIVENSDNTLRISVRAPLADRKNADTLCRAFPSGGGRSAAAGINRLPAGMLDSFISAFQITFDQGAVPAIHCP